MDAGILEVLRKNFLAGSLDVTSYVVGIRVVVAVAVAGTKNAADMLLAFKVAFQRIQQFAHGEHLVVKYKLLNGRQRVHCCGEAYAFHKTQVERTGNVARRIQIHAGRECLVVKRVFHGRGISLTTLLLNLILEEKGIAHHELNLPLECVPKLLPCAERAGITCFHGRTNLLHSSSGGR